MNEAQGKLLVLDQRIEERVQAIRTHRDWWPCRRGCDSCLHNQFQHQLLHHLFAGRRGTSKGRQGFRFTLIVDCDLIEYTLFSIS